jgi:hypothetical protein
MERGSARKRMDLIGQGFPADDNKSGDNTRYRQLSNGTHAVGQIGVSP